MQNILVGVSFNMKLAPAALLILPLAHAIEPRTYNVSKLTALDCRSPSRIVTTALEHLCKGDTNDTQKVSSEPVILLQQTDAITFKGYRCVRRMSTFLATCGAFSHSKLYSPPRINEAALFNHDDCATSIATGTYRKPDNNLIQLPLNKEISFSYIAHGSLTYSQDNVYCQGSSMKIGGSIVSSIVEYRYETVFIQETEFRINKEGDVIELSNNEILPRNCAKTVSCNVNNAAYVFNYPEEVCFWIPIRKLDLESIFLNTKGKNSEYLISHEHKFLLEKSETQIDTKCKNYRFAHKSTLSENLAMITQDMTISELEAIPVTGDIVDINLEVAATTAYLNFRLEKLITNQLDKVGTRLCSMGTHNLEHAELSPFHKDSLLRLRGDILQELTCNPIEVIARIGENRNNKCFSEALPVWYENKPFLITARNHLLIEQDKIDEIPCNSAYQSIFIGTKGELLKSEPEVKIVYLKLQKTKYTFLHNAIDHETFTSDLLYTQEEIDKFNNLVHFGRTKKRVLNNLVTNYCAKNSMHCGAYAPSQVPDNFDLGNLKYNAFSPTHYFTEILEKVRIAGNVCSILVVLIVALSWFYRMVRVIFLICFRKQNITTAVKLSFNITPSIPQTNAGLPESKQQVSEYPVSSKNQSPDYENMQMIPIHQPSGSWNQ